MSALKIREEVLRAVSDIEIRTRRKVTSPLAGDFRSAFRGSGMQFKEFRHYEPGDDIRHISWTVTARTRRTTVKVYEEERELDVCLIVDVSGSSAFGTLRRKIDMYAELVALIGLAAVQSRDNLSVLLFSDRPGPYLPPRRSRDSVLVALTRLYEQGLGGGKSDLAGALRYAQSLLKRRSLVVVISDFLVPEFDRELKALGARHELTLVHCFDDAERGQALEGVHEARDPETGEIFLFDANSRRSRRALSQHHEALSRKVRELSRGSAADYIGLSVEDDYIQKLVEFFRRRGPARI